MTWEAFLRHILLGLIIFVSLPFLLIILMNPYGNLPVHLFGSHVIMDSNQRFQYPTIVRSENYDSAVLGTSTARLLDPSDLEREFGGHFANLAMNDGRAWEQIQLAKLLFKSVAHVKTVLIGMDVVWCTPDADVARTTGRGFPTWIYDDNPINDWFYLFNYPTLEISVRKLGYHLGVGKRRWAANGFDVFVPPESSYDVARAQKHIWENGPHGVVPAKPAYVPSLDERKSWAFPALDWLADLIDKTDQTTRFVLVFMPVHVATQPAPGSILAAREAECKARVAKIAGHRGNGVIDMRIASPITTLDSNYWDSLHYRLPVGQRIVADVRRAFDSRADDPHGEWVYLPGT
jgi:hypothetical protein